MTAPQVEPRCLCNNNCYVRTLTVPDLDKRRLAKLYFEAPNIRKGGPFAIEVKIDHITIFSQTCKGMTNIYHRGLE